MFFDIFYDLCKKKGVSCKKAAEEIGLSNSITTKWKKTGATPGGETLDKVAAYFSVSTDYLLGIEENKISPSELVLTEGEMDLIKLFRQIPVEQQPAVLGIIRAALIGK